MCGMYTVKFLPPFTDWLNRLPDRTARLRLSKRLDKAARGILGDVKSVGGGIYEMREHFGAGYRMYYIRRGAVVIVMLGGGDKSSQSRDVEQALQLAQTLED